MATMRQWVLADRPTGRPLKEDDWSLRAVPVPEPADGQFLVRLLWLGFDPAQKGWMENVADYVAPMALGDVMRGSGVGQVVRSRHSDFAEGALVAGQFGWQEFALSDGRDVDPVLPGVPPTAMLGVLGLTGLTAYCGLFKLGEPIAGDTVLVSGAAGATGSVVGQLARLAGCRVVGIAGGADKCAWLTGELGYDAAIDYKAGQIRPQLKALLPGGADVVYDNVGGAILNDMLAHIATGARVVICGGISRYQTGRMPAGPENYFNLVFRRATMRGFIVLDWAAEFPAIRRRLAGFLADGRLQYREDIQHGFENAPRTLMRLFEGANFGKQLLQVAEPA